MQDREKGDPAAGRGGDEGAAGERMFTQSELGAIAAKEARRERERLLRRLGLENEEAGEGYVEELRREIADARAHITALDMGVPAGRREQYLRLAETYREEEGDLARAIERALREFPIEVKRKPVPGEGANPATPQGRRRPGGTVRF